MRISNFYFFLLFIFLNNFLISQEISFNQSCKITDQIIIETNEGKPKRYKGFNDELVIGDYFKTTFIFDFSVSNYSINVKTNTGIDSSIRREDFILVNDSNVLFLNEFVKMMFGPNEIAFEHTEGEIDMYRYYKDDWNLHFRASYFNQSQIIVANCQSLSKKYDQVLKTLYRIHGEN